MPQEDLNDAILCSQEYPDVNEEGLFEIDGETEIEFNDIYLDCDQFFDFNIYSIEEMDELYDFFEENLLLLQEEYENQDPSYTIECFKDDFIDLEPLLRNVRCYYFFFEPDFVSENKAIHHLDLTQEELDRIETFHLLKLLFLDDLYTNKLKPRPILKEEKTYFYDKDNIEDD
jgi:hypothetical protein